MTIDLGELLPPKTVIPVLQINSADEAVPLAGALIQGGLRVLEITLRTDAAEQSARNIIQAFPDALVGIGTVRDAVGLQKALSLNA
ncbi:MAG: keto-deoxy-phosphogluconate aldolase, partial [Pseudomonadota bacterium]|nr:keto-deoxy-phosphogluconate aldolase [Pseudomonadota bacterium]